MTSSEIGSDLKITKRTRQAAGAGTWVCGRLHGHRFEALVFPEHAVVAEYELGQSQISKLFVQRLADRQTVVEFDRGWDLHPTTAEAEAIVDFLETRLADMTYGTRG